MSNGKKIISGNEAKQAIKRGVDKIANAVASTLGPRGRCVILSRSWGSPYVTKDGVTIAKEIALTDKFEDMGAQMIKTSAQKTCDEAGDGTTTATLLAQEIYNQGYKLLASEYNPVDMKRGIDKAIDAVVEGLKEFTKETQDKEEIAQVGTISANDAEIGRLLADAMEKVGREGVITIEEGSGDKTILEFADGMEFDRGWLSPYFITDPEKSRCVLKDCYILLTDMRLENPKELVPLFEELAGKGKPILLIGDDFGQTFIATLVINKQNGVLQSCAVKAPGFGDRRKEIIKDLCVLTGAKLISQDVGLEMKNVELSHLGTAEKIVMTRGTTTIIGGSGTRESIEDRCNQIRNDMKHVDNNYERERMAERLAKLSGGIAVIRVGAPTEPEMKEKKDRVEDAMYATRSAVEEGIVAGGGVALVRCKKFIDAILSSLNNDDERAGAKIIQRALEAPLRKIAENAGVKSELIIAEVLKATDPFYGYNASTEKFENLVEAGIVDPKKVVRCALQNAGSVASMLLITDNMIADETKEEKE